MGQKAHRLNADTILAAVVGSALVAASGISGTRLVPDSRHYASGHFSPSPFGGLVGYVGGMPLLIATSAIAAGIVVALLPSWRARLLFFTFGGFWFLFPGVDAAGLLVFAVMQRSPHRRTRVWLVLSLTHAVAAIAAVGLLIRRRQRLLAFVLPSIVIITFATVGWFTSEPINPFVHAAWTTRYLLPFVYLSVSRS